MAKSSYFRVKDVLFSSIFAAGCDELAAFYRSDLAESFGLADAEKADALTVWADQTRSGLEQCWDESMGRYLCLDQNQKGEKRLLVNPLNPIHSQDFHPYWRVWASTWNERSAC